MLEFLERLEANYEAAVDAMMSLLQETAPEHGARLREPLSKALGDHLYEFRKEPKGKRLRVLYFFDRGQVIVCTNAFVKAEQTPRTELERCRRLREQYLRDKADGNLRIDDDSEDS